MTPTDARRELYRLQTDCERAGLSYADVAWGCRYPTPAPATTGAWPFQRVAAVQAANVTTLKGRRKP